MATELQLVDDGSQVGQNVNQSVAVVEPSSDFDLPGAGGSYVVHNATVLSAKLSSVDQLLLMRFGSDLGICRRCVH
jgi:hypothetical protein